MPRAVRYADLAGIEGVLQDVRELIERPLKHPEVSLHRAPPDVIRSSCHAADVSLHAQLATCSW